MGGYKLLNPLNKQIVMSRDVVFDETNGWNWTSNAYKQYKGVIIESEVAETIEKQNVVSNRRESTSSLRISQEIVIRICI